MFLRIPVFFILFVLTLQSAGCLNNFITREEEGLNGEIRSIEQRILLLVNEYRREHHLRPLSKIAYMSYIARRHSRDMAGQAVPVGHQGFEKRVRVIAWMYQKRRASENVSYLRGYGDYAGSFVKAWIRSHEHRQNILGDFTFTGIGVVKGYRGGYYATQIFWN